SPTSNAPTQASLLAPRSANRVDCHQVPIAHVMVAAVITIPAAPTDNPRTRVSISGTNPSIAANEAEVRNAAAAVAGSPGRARNVPFGATRRKAGTAIKAPTGTRIAVHTLGSVSPARSR